MGEGIMDAFRSKIPYKVELRQNNSIKINGFFEFLNACRWQVFLLWKANVYARWSPLISKFNLGWRAGYLYIELEGFWMRCTTFSGVFLSGAFLLAVDGAQATEYQAPAAGFMLAAERCINTLKSQPAEGPENFVFDGKIVSDVSVFRIVPEEAAASFNECISAADKKFGHDDEVFKIIKNNNYSSVESDVSNAYRVWSSVALSKMLGGESGRLRYIYSNSYRRHYLLEIDTLAMIRMFRTPPSDSIEGLGSWNGNYKEPLDCHNAYGDPCGSRYENTGRDGWQLIK